MDERQGRSGGPRREFLVMAALSAVGVGAGLALWPLVRQMAPNPHSEQTARLTVDLAAITAGSWKQLPWQSPSPLPVIVRHRTAAEVESAMRATISIDARARNDALDASAPVTDRNRAVAAWQVWLVVVGMCTK